MKKYILIIVVFILCGCEFSLNRTDVNELIFNQEDEKEELSISYEDENPVKISLYVDNTSGGLDKVTDEFRETWRLKRDIVVFGSVFSDEEELASDYFQNIWKNNAQNYENFQKYKTGWHVSFQLLDGTIYDQMIFNPIDVTDFYDYLELYLYDSANQPIGKWYSHLTEEDMKDDTVMTSLKLTAGSKFEQIASEITVSVFTYDSEDDFDVNGKYRGNSMSTVKVYND
ncbi:MAG: hypothetical protein E7167_05435 [Firmicutes bacterium]|nr:hypothetical protein [Bacillota bacterium]